MITQEFCLPGEAAWVFPPEPEENSLLRLYRASEAAVSRVEPLPVRDLIR
jgi:hypothetical protein